MIGYRSLSEVIIAKNEGSKNGEKERDHSRLEWVIFQSPLPLWGRHSIKNYAEDHGRKPVGESVQLKFVVMQQCENYDILYTLWKYD